ncbi:MAG: 50S ribosomal protein L44e [Candidatus Hodarchaeota archaeon]
MRNLYRFFYYASCVVGLAVKLPGQLRTYCRTCRKHTVHDVKIERGGRRGRGLSAGTRRAERHRSGHGNRGRYSKRPLSQWKMIVKTSKKTDLRLICQECKKQQTRVYPRTRRVELVR